MFVNYCVFDFGCVLYWFVKIIYSLPLFKKIKYRLGFTRLHFLGFVGSFEVSLLFEFQRSDP